MIKQSDGQTDRPSSSVSYRNCNIAAMCFYVKVCVDMCMCNASSRHKRHIVRVVANTFSIVAAAAVVIVVVSIVSGSEKKGGQ